MRRGNYGRPIWIQPLDDGSLVRHVAVVGFVAVVLMTGLVAPASAHGWQNTTTADGDELGIHTDPEKPVASTETEFLAHIRNASAPEQTGHAGGAINETVTVTIAGPKGSCDRLTTTMPENDSHFAFSYRFPTAGTYEITMRTTIEGEEVRFRTDQQVAAPTTSADNPSQTETASTDGPPRTETGSNNDTIRRKLTTIQFLSGTSIVVAAGALWAAVLAYRGTD